MNKNNGAFGGTYNHDVIKTLRKELSLKSIMLAAVVQHTGLDQKQVEQIATAYLKAEQQKLLAQK